MRTTDYKLIEEYLDYRFKVADGAYRTKGIYNGLNFLSGKHYDMVRESVYGRIRINIRAYEDGEDEFILQFEDYNNFNFLTQIHIKSRTKDKVITVYPNNHDFFIEFINWMMNIIKKETVRIEKYGLDYLEIIPKLRKMKNLERRLLKQKNNN